MLSRAGLIALPAPDCLECVWDPQGVCAILGDGHPLAAALERHLVDRGWRVVQVADSGDPAAWPETLRTIGDRFGRVAAFIDIHGGSHNTGDQLANETEEKRLESSFFLAKHLHPVLTASPGSRAWYVIVTHVDGRLGLADASIESGIVSAGAFALAKTLRQEWPSVFCRAIDLDPEMDPDTAARLVAGELHDSDLTLAEVGLGPAGRCTLTALEIDRG